VDCRYRDAGEVADRAPSAVRRVTAWRPLARLGRWPAEIEGCMAMAGDRGPGHLDPRGRQRPGARPTRRPTDSALRPGRRHRRGESTRRRPV